MLRYISKTIISSGLRHQHFIHTTPAADESLTTITEKNGIREIKLNQPKTRNVLSLAMMDSIMDGLTKNLHDDSLRCIVISSTGTVFSAGHSLREMTADKSPDSHREIFDKCALLSFEIRNAPVPVIAKVNGLAAAAGCQLVASCDMVICSDKSSFSTPGVVYGIFCHTPGVAIARVMPKMKSAYMLLTGIPINAQDAFISGLASVVVPANKLDEEIVKICKAIKSKSRAVLQMGKKFYYTQLELNIHDAYEQGVGTMVENLGLNDGKEGVLSFMEKRQPKWSHS